MGSNHANFYPTVKKRNSFTQEFFELKRALKFNDLKTLVNSSRADKIRTCDPYVPNVVRYRAALLPEI